jgi:hypothetical protein
MIRVGTPSSRGGPTPTDHQTGNRARVGRDFCARSERLAAAHDASARSAGGRRHRASAAALLDGVGALIERVGSAGRGEHPARESSTPPRSNTVTPHLSHVPSPPAPQPPPSAGDHRIVRPPQTPPREPPQGARPRNRLIDRNCAISRHLSGKRAGKSPPPPFSGRWGKARARNEEKGGRGRKAGFRSSPGRDRFCGLLLARPGPPVEKGR